MAKRTNRKDSGSKRDSSSIIRSGQTAISSVPLPLKDKFTVPVKASFQLINCKYCSIRFNMEAAWARVAFSWAAKVVSEVPLIMPAANA
jgi:hypothetical protein